MFTLKSVGEMQSLHSPEMMLTMKKGVQQRRKTPMMIPMVMAALCSRYSGVLVSSLLSSLCLLRRSLRACAAGRANRVSITVEGQVASSRDHATYPSVFLTYQYILYVKKVFFPL